MGIGQQLILADLQVLRLTGTDSFAVITGNVLLSFSLFAFEIVLLELVRLRLHS